MQGSSFSLSSSCNKDARETVCILKMAPDCTCFPAKAPILPTHQKVEVTSATVVADPGKVGRVIEATTPTLAAQVGGACSIVHVLEWKEGMTILPSSNLKVSFFCLCIVVVHVSSQVLNIIQWAAIEKVNEENN